MGQIGDNIRRIKYDCGNSWYFRIWAFFWLICFALGVAVLFIISGRVTADTTAGKAFVRTTLKQADSLYFPRFRAKSDLDIESLKCTKGSTTINTEKCNGSPKCMIVNSDKESAKASSIATDIINCEATVTPNNGVANKYLFVDVETDSGVVTTGVNSGEPLAIPETSGSAMILLQKSTFTDENGVTSSRFERVLTYTSTEQAPANTYKFSIRYSTLDVVEDEVIKSMVYDGWNSAAQIGGFIFFMYVLHQILMFLIGIFFTNNSKFLKGEPVNYNRQSDKP